MSSKLLNFLDEVNPWPAEPDSTPKTIILLVVALVVVLAVAFVAIKSIKASSTPKKAVKKNKKK